MSKRGNTKASAPEGAPWRRAIAYRWRHAARLWRWLGVIVMLPALAWLCIGGMAIGAPASVPFIHCDSPSATFWCYRRADAAGYLAMSRDEFGDALGDEKDVQAAAAKQGVKAVDRLAFTVYVSEDGLVTSVQGRWYDLLKAPSPSVYAPFGVGRSSSAPWCVLTTDRSSDGIPLWVTTSRSFEVVGDSYADRSTPARLFPLVTEAIRAAIIRTAWTGYTPEQLGDGSAYRRTAIHWDGVRYAARLLAVPLLVLLLPVAAWCTWLLIGFVRVFNRLKRGACLRCGYPGTPAGVCPECGSALRVAGGES